MTVVVIVVVAWLCVLAVLFALLTMAKRADENMVRAMGSEAIPRERSLASFAAAVQRRLAAERVVVIVTHPSDERLGRIVACAGAAGVAGRFVRLDQPERAGISAREEEIALLGFGPEAIVGGWVVAHSPMVRSDGTAGVVAVGSRQRAFTGSDLAVLVDLASTTPVRFHRVRGGLRRRIGA